VARFWEIYELLNEKAPIKGTNQELVVKERLNHSVKEDLIAINLQHFYQVISEERMETMPTSELRKLLTSSRKYKLVDKNKAVQSKIFNKTIRCFVFNKYL